jgi:hypothetical protein
MTRTGWWWIGILLLVGILSGCGDDDHDHHDDHRQHRDCGESREEEPNDTRRTANSLGEALRGDCAVVLGKLSEAQDVDTFRFRVGERLTLAVTLDHDATVTMALQFVDADTGDLIQDCGSGVAPLVCDVPFPERSHAIAVDAVVTSVSGTGLYTLALDTQ